MRYNPPIEYRSTDELLEMVSNIDDWNEDALLMARNELINRGVCYETQNFNEQINKKAKRKKNLIKENASYTIFFRLLLLFFPFITFFPFSSDTIIGLENEGYYKKAKQRFFFLLGGFLIWFLIALNFLR